MYTKTGHTSHSTKGKKVKHSAVVIGGGFGGLAAAMRLLAKGYKVFVLEKNMELGGRGSCIMRSGHRFDLGPTIVTLPNMFRELWQFCGRNFDDYVDLKPLDEFYKIKFWDGETITISENYDEVLDQVRGLSPVDEKGFRKFLVDAEKRYKVAFENTNTMGREPMNKLWATLKMLPIFALLRADRSVFSHVAKRVSDPRLRFALSFHPLFVGANPFTVTSMWGIVSHIEKEFGISTASGGFGGIAEAMGKVIQEMGGTIRLGDEVQEIIVEGRVAKGVILKSGEVIDAEVVVSNSDPMTTYSELGKRTRKKWWSHENFTKKQWSMSLFVWHFGTKGTRDLWKDVDQHTILQGPNYKGEVDKIFFNGGLDEDMSLYVHRPTRNDTTAAPPGDDTFYALACVPNLQIESDFDWERDAEKYKEKVLKTLETRLLPGLSGHIVESYYMTPLDFKERYNSPFGAGFSLEPGMFQSAWFRPHNISEEIKGLFLVGAGTHPGPGVPGVLASAEVVTKLIPSISHSKNNGKVSKKNNVNLKESLAAE